MKKRRFNQVLSCVLALILIISMVPAVNVSAAETDITEVAGTTSSGLEYEISGTEVTITDYTGSATTLTIPSVIEGYPVTSIDDYAFSGCSSLTSITIPESVTSIGESVFYECTNLTSITVDEDNAVYDSRNNCNAIIETNTNMLIAGCVNTVIPSSVTSIGANAFDGAQNLTSITIPSSVTGIGNLAFFECTSLTSITIPSSVTNIGDYAFNNCISLASITVDEDNAVYDSRNNCNAIIETNTNTLIAGCANTVIPSSVTSIGNEAFRGCTRLTGITIPSSVKSIDVGAFENCTSLTSITIPEGVESIGDWTFFECKNLTSITISSSVASIGLGAFYDCTSLTDVYYGGTQSRWNAIAIDDYNHYNSCLLNAEIHYISDYTVLSANSTNSATISASDQTKYYLFTPSTSGKYVIYSTGTFDTKVYLYDSQGNQLTYNDDADGSNNRNFRLEYNLTAGNTYYYGVKYYSDSTTGTISFKFGRVYTISYNANGGSGAPSAQYKDYGTSITLSSTEPTRSGYEFLGWSTSSTATTASYQSGGTYSSESNATLYAVWSYVDTTNLTVSISSTNNVASSQTATLTMSDNVGVVSYYWGTSSTPASSSFTTITSTTSKTVTKTVSSSGTYYLIAKDAAGNTATTSVTFYNTTLNANGGSVSPTSILTMSGNTITLPTPTRSGYVFVGWGPSTIVTVGSDSSYAPESNSTLKAIWKDSPFGDVDENGVVNFEDVLLINKGIRDVLELHPWQMILADVNGDETVTMEDIEIINNFRLGKISEFPVEEGDIQLVINNFPDKTDYYVDDEISTEGLSVLLYCQGTSTGYDVTNLCDVTVPETETSGTKYIEISLKDKYSTRCSVTISEDNTNPTVSVSSTNYIASSQTVTLTMSDNVGVVSYYWGTSSSPANSSFTSITSTKSYSTTRTVSSNGVYYLIAKDAQGNTATTSVTFYKTILNVNGGGSVSPASILTKSGNTITLPTPTRSGYEFVDWGTSSSATSGVKSITVSSNKTYYAVWRSETGVLSVDSSYSAVISTGGQEVKYEFTPSTTGKYVIYSTGTADTKVYLYNSNGSTLESDDDGAEDRNFRLEYTLTAGSTYHYGVTYYNSSQTGTISFKFGKVYSVSYSANEGSGAPYTQYKDYGKTVYLSEDEPYRSGCEFLGWSTSSTATSATYQPGDAYSANSDLSLYAVWRSETGVLSVDSSYSAVISTGGQEVKYEFTPSTTGKYVIYSTGSVDTKVYLYNASGNQITYDDDGTGGVNFRLAYNLTAGNTYYYGVRYYNSSNTGTIPFKFGRVYTVSYRANGGSGALADQEKDYGKTIYLSEDEPYRSGCEFLGWSTSSTAASATYQPGDAYSANSDAILYAVWDGVDSTNPTVSVSSTNNIASSQTVTLTMSDNEGVVSYYWGTSSSPANSSFTSITSTKSYSTTRTVSSNGVYYLIAKDAQGNTATTSVTFYKTILNVNGGGSVSPASILTKSGNTITLPTPTRSGYEFVGWGTSSSATSGVKSITVSSNKTYYAIWELAVESIAVQTLPKTQFYLGDYFERSGLSLKITYSDGSSRIITSGFETDFDDVVYFDSKGTFEVVVYYDDLTTTYDVYVLEPSVTLIPNTAYLDIGDTEDLSILTNPASVANITWVSTDEEVVTVENGEVTAVSPGTAEVYVKFTYGGRNYMSNSCIITVNEPATVEGISIETYPTKREYYIGDSLNTTGMELRVEYSDGTNQKVSSGFTTSGFDSSSAGTKTVSVSYEGFTDSFTVSVVSPEITLSSINLSVGVGKTVSLTVTTSPANQSVTWNSSNTNVATVFDGNVTAKAPGVSVVSAEIVVNGRRYNASCAVSVVEISKIEINSLPKTTYYIGETLTTEGLELKLVYPDGAYDVTSEYDSLSYKDGYAFSSAGTYEVKVNYGKFSTSYNIEVRNLEVEITTDNITLNVGETAELTVDAHGITPDREFWRSLNSKVVTVNNGVVKAVGAGKAEVTVTVIYKKFGWESNKCVITVIDPATIVESISVKSMPTKTDYFIKDEFDSAGLELEVTYADGSVKTISSGFTVEGFSSDTAGTKNVVVKYEGFEANFNVTVNTPGIVLDIADKLYVGETIEALVQTYPEGGTVEWQSSDESVVTVSNGEITAHSKGTATITASINHNGVSYSAVHDITVEEREVLFMLGDANLDGVVNIKDATAIQKHIAKLESLSQLSLMAADADVSSDVNIKDATAIQKHIAGIETGYPIGKSE